MLIVLITLRIRVCGRLGNAEATEGAIQIIIPKALFQVGDRFTGFSNQGAAMLLSQSIINNSLLLRYHSQRATQVAHRRSAIRH